MAYDYQKTKKLYEQMNDQQKQQFAQDTTGNVQQFLSDYQKETGNNVYTPTTTQKTTNTYQNQGAGNYTYNPTSGYYEKSSGGYQNQGEGNYVYNPTSGYYENQNKNLTDSVNNFSNQANDIYQNAQSRQSQNQQQLQNNANMLNSLSQQAMNNYNQSNKGYSDLMGGGSNYAQNFDDAVSNKLKSAFGINNLAEFKNKYPEYYDSLVQGLESIRGVWDATDPTQRQMLDGQLQGIIGSMVGAGSDTSKLNVLNQTLMNKFENGEQVSEDMRNIVKLQTEGKSISDIAAEMGISEDQVQQAILAYNGLDNKLGEYYKLKSDVAKDITEPYDTKMQRLDEEKKIALERANRNVDYLKQDFDTELERQKQANDINAHNADAISGQFGFGFSKRGIEGLNYVADQAKQIIDDITKNYDRNNQNLADGIADIIRNWQRNNDDLMKASQDALTNAKNNFTSNMLAVQQKYGTVGMQAQQYLAQNVQSFIEQAESIYDNALTRQQQNLTNLINNVSNINALEAQNLTMRQAKIEQFQNESMNLNRNQLQQLAQQLGMDSASYQDLVNYQAQAVANELNGYLPGAGVQFQSQIQSLLDSGYTPTEAMNNIMNSADFQAMQQAANGSNEYAISGNYIYNKNTGEYQQLGSDDNWAISGDYKINKATGETVRLDGSSVGGTNYVSSQTVNGQTYGVSANTIQGLQSFASQYPIDSIGGQCGAFANKYLQSLGLQGVFTDPIKDKIGAINTPDGYTGQIGDIIVMDSPTQPKYGHVAIITGVNADGTYTTLESNRKNNDGVVFSRTIDPNKDKVYGFYHPDGVTNGVTDYDINTAVMRIGRQAYGANISDSESKRVESVLRDGASMGKDQTEILYDVLGMKINNNLEQATPFIDIMVQNSDKDGLSAYNLVGFSDFINKGEFEKAMNLVEQAVAKERGGNYASDLSKYENGSKYAYTKGDEMIDAINKQTAKLGIVAGRVTDKWSKVMGDKDFQKLKSSIVNYIADWRHEMLGSATTDTELKMIDDLIPSITDNPANTITKIKEFQDYWLNKYNQTRGNLYLPSVTKDSVLDKNKRVQLYFGNTSNNGVSAIGLLADQLNRLQGNATKTNNDTEGVDLRSYGRTGK